MGQTSRLQHDAFAGPIFCLTNRCPHQPTFGGRAVGIKSVHSAPRAASPLTFDERIPPPYESAHDNFAARLQHPYNASSRCFPMHS